MKDGYHPRPMEVGRGFFFSVFKAIKKMPSSPKIREKMKFFPI